MTDIERAWETVRRDLRAHPSGYEVYMSIRSAMPDEMLAMEMTMAEIAQLRIVTVGVPGGAEVGAGVHPGHKILAVLADRVQDVIEETWHEAWPSCPHHGTSASVNVEGGDAVWRCPSGDWIVPIGELSTAL